MDIAHVIQTSIAPVFLFTGIAATLGVFTNRLSRIVDRARKLESDLENHPGRATHLSADLAALERRARYINTAISLSGLAALLTSLVIVMLFASAFVGKGFALVTALLFVVAILCLSTAFIVFLLEVRIAVAFLRIGLPQHR